jgi:TusA-related sulfurtransferase
MKINREIDARGFTCPIPILKAKRALSEMQTGDVLRVLATDAGTIKDFQAYATQSGNELVSQQALATDFYHVLRRR